MQGPGVLLASCSGPRSKDPIVPLPSPILSTLVTTVLVTISLAGCAGLGNRVDGTLVEVQEWEEPDTAAILVELDEGDIIGSTDVLLIFDLDVLRCIEGGEASADDLRPGIDVRAQRTDNDAIESMDPPPVRGTDVAIRCGD